MNPMSFVPAELTTGESKRIHLIGVAGSGMSGLAGLLLALGHQVSGSDKVDTSEVRRLQAEGLAFHGPHAARHVHDVDAVVYSSAVKVGNPAYDEAVRLDKPLLRRAEALAALMLNRRGILVAGMHGKTTTSSMVAHLLRAGGLRPSPYVGAEIPILGTNAHWDQQGSYFVAEGDESDGTVALFQPEHTILLNIEEEHLDYYRDLAAIEVVFARLLDQTRGSVFFCADDYNASRLCASRERTVSYGADERADYRYGQLHQEQFQSRFSVYRRGELLGEAVLNVPGQHNVSNATSAIAVAMELGVNFATIVGALESFQGARRRFEFKHRSPSYTVVDDYGHHPSEVLATLATARSGHAGRIITLFQPHRYTRTLALCEQFGRSFHPSDIVIVTEIYPASELPLPGVSGQLIVDCLHKEGHPNAVYAANFKQLAARVGGLVQPGDLVVSLGAGNIHEAATRLVRDLTIFEELSRMVSSEGSVKLYEPLSTHTTLRVGGPARFWAEPSTEQALARMIRFAAEKNLPVFMMGRGSNLLVRDGGIDGLVIHPHGGQFAALTIDAKAFEVTAGSAVGLKRLAGSAAKAGIGGFEWMEGIPGEVGGSLRMNAGAMGIETFDQVTKLRLMDGAGAIRECLPDELEIHYRNVPSLRQEYALAATFRGVDSARAVILAQMDASTSKRKTSQPVAASAGCIFKNPTKECSAGKLVQELGLKNRRVGEARVSEVHGNFIVNEGGATAADVLGLIDQILTRAWEERGIHLETEVQIVGQD